MSAGMPVLRSHTPEDVAQDVECAAQTPPRRQDLMQSLRLTKVDFS